MRGFACIAMAAVGIVLIPASAEAAPRGSYLRSCEQVQDTGRGRNAEISAQCRDERGRMRYSSLRYRTCQGDIANVRGQLTCPGGRPGSGGQGNDWDNNRPGNGSGWNSARLPGGSWTQSCRNHDMRGTVLQAECKGEGKRWVDTQIDTRQCRGRNVANVYGNLVCQR